MKKIDWSEVLYSILKWPVRAFVNGVFSIKEIKLENAKSNEAYLMLGHHVTAFDPIILNAYNDKLIRFVAADANYDNWLKKYLLKAFGSIAISKRRSDMKSVKAIWRQLRNGNPVGIFPEGGRNWDGETDTIIKSTAKLIKTCKVDVYCAVFDGFYLSDPRWSKKRRKGKTSLITKKIITKSELKEMSVDQVHEALIKNLYHNAYEEQATKKVAFKSSCRAEYIERLIYLCPNCMKLNTIESKNNDFICKNCGHSCTYDEYGYIHGKKAFSDTVKWNKWQKSKLKSVLKSKFDFENESIKLLKINNKVRNKCYVNMSVTNDGIIINDKQKKEKIMYNDIKGLSVTFKDTCEFFIDKTKYRLKFNPRKHMSINLFCDLIKVMKEGE